MTIRTFQGKEREDVVLWVQYLLQVGKLSGWRDKEAVALAELHMTHGMPDKAQSRGVGLDRSTLALMLWQAND